MNTNDRDMFYSGYYGMSPIPNMQIQNPNTQIPNPNIMSQFPYNYETNYNTTNYNNYSNLENKLTRIENQIKLINQRLTRLETSNNNIYNNEPDSNMYMM